VGAAAAAWERTSKTWECGDAGTRAGDGGVGEGKHGVGEWRRRHRVRAAAGCASRIARAVSVGRTGGKR
jgi:hypothetical protein